MLDIRETSESTCYDKEIYCVSVCVCTIVLNSDNYFIFHLLCFSSTELFGCWVKALPDVITLPSTQTVCKRDNCLSK